MTDDHWESLLDRDWSGSWTTLPDAPELVSRKKTAQITLRLPVTLLARIKRVARIRSIPYHALTRSWLADALRHDGTPDCTIKKTEDRTKQFNIKLNQAILDGLKKRAHEMGQPYHRVAREWIEWQTTQAEEALGLNPMPLSQPSMIELMVLLLHAPNQNGYSTIQGMTRLQKLLFVIQQKLAGPSEFYAFNYGPFNEEVIDAERALEIAGFIGSTEPESTGRPSFQEMLASANERAASNQGSKGVEFTLSSEGHQAAERLRRSSPSYEQLFIFVEAIKKEWDTPNLIDLIARVYEEYPDYAEKSFIREEVERRGQDHRRSN